MPTIHTSKGDFDTSQLEKRVELIEGSNNGVPYTMVVTEYRKDGALLLRDSRLEGDPNPSVREPDDEPPPAAEPVTEPADVQALAVEPPVAKKAAKKAAKKRKTPPSRDARSDLH